jgi:hypothetical protein
MRTVTPFHLASYQLSRLRAKQGRRSSCILTEPTEFDFGSFVGYHFFMSIRKASALTIAITGAQGVRLVVRVEGG